MTRLRRFFHGAVGAAKERGEVPPDLDVERTAEQIFSAQIAMSVLGRTGTDNATLSRIVEGALDLLN